MQRRDVLKLAAAAAVASTGATGATSAGAASRQAAVYVPGYRIKRAFFGGGAARYHPTFARNVPDSYTGTVRMLTRVGADGDVRQALFPINGHDVAVAPNGRVGVFVGYEASDIAAFDPATLDLVGLGAPAGDDWRGGGHAVYVDDGELLAVSERAPTGAYRGAPDRHFGQVTLRDPETLKLVERFSCHGIDPHEIRLLSDGEHLAVANYGSTYPPGGTSFGAPRHVVEPSVAILSLKSGKLAEKYVTGSTAMELRHLCVADRDAIIAVQAELGPPRADQAYRRGDKVVYERERSSSSKWTYLPAPPLLLRRPGGAFETLGPERLRAVMRHGLSIEYDPTHKEALTTFPATHLVMALDGATGAVKRVIDTAAAGLDYPCGLTLLPDGRHYAVTGFWKNLFVYERGTHRLVRDRCSYATFFGHRHITAA